MRLVAMYEYDPYGNRVNEPAETEYEQPFQFSTHQFDPETGHIYAKERYYQPDEGRWLSADPIGERGGFNLFAYVKNGPIDSIDPFGREECGSPIRCSLPDGSCTLWPPAPPAGFPDLPSHETLDYPVITWKPGWWWGINPGCSYYNDVAYAPSEGFGLTMRNLPETSSLVNEAKDDLARKLKYDCTDCCKNAGTVRGARYVDGLAGTSTQDKYMRQAPGGTWWHVGSFRLRYFANCNVATTCNGCKASCAITYDLWDSWHWGAAPGTSCGGLNQFNWHVTWYCVDFISSPCSDKPTTSQPTSQVGASH